VQVRDHTDKRRGREDARCQGVLNERTCEGVPCPVTQRRRSETRELILGNDVCVNAVGKRFAAGRRERRCGAGGVLARRPDACLLGGVLLRNTMWFRPA
jgi:hypothetical protein